MTLTTVAVALLIGMAAGISSGFFGIGGGIIIVPLLGVLLMLPLQNAVATSLFALIFPVGILAVWTYYKSGFLTPNEMKIGSLVACGLVIGALAGSRLAIRLPADILRLAFAALLIFMAVRLLFFSKG